MKDATSSNEVRKDGSTVTGMIIYNDGTTITTSHDDKGNPMASAGELKDNEKNLSAKDLLKQRQEAGKTVEQEFNRDLAGEGVAGPQRTVQQASTAKDLEAGLRAAGLYDAQGKFLKDGQEDGKLGMQAVEGLDKFIAGLQKDNHLDAKDPNLQAETIAAIEQKAKDGKISGDFAKAVEQVISDGTMSALNEKFGKQSPTQVASGETVTPHGSGKAPASKDAGTVHI